MRELKRILGSNTAYADANNDEQNLCFTVDTSTVKGKDVNERLVGVRAGKGDIRQEQEIFAENSKGKCRSRNINTRR
jgi:hypothetical protein